MSRWRLRSNWRFLALAIVAGAFAFAGVRKLGDPAGFATDIGNYRLVSPVIAAGLALYLPWLELFLAGGLLTLRFRLAARMLAIGLLVLFCIGLVSALARGLDIRCGCFGSAADGGGVTVGWALIRNLGLIALLLFASCNASQSNIEDGRNSK